VFGDRASGAFMHRFSWTNILRHPIVMGVASPDDPALSEYWAGRRRKAVLPINRTVRWLHQAQDGCCAICRASLLPVDDRPQTPREWEAWLATTRKTLDVIREDGASDKAEPRLIHTHCSNWSPELLPARQPPGLA
jgi:RNA-directed DNA polymerase